MKQPRLRLGSALGTVLAVAVLAGACAGSDDPEPSGRIVTFGSPEIGLVPADGGKVEYLRIGEAFSDVEFSPDGSQVAFNTDPGGIAILSPESDRAKLVPNQPSQERALSGDIAWAPDGKRLAFVNDGTIFTIATDGSELREVTRGLSPSWTSDGERLVFVSSWDLSSASVGDLNVIGVDGAERRLLGRGLHPVVSPSGDDVAYSTPDGVFVQPLAGGAPQLVVGDGFGPVWSPDGEYLAFTRYTACPSDHGPCIGRIFVVPVTGGEPRASRARWPTRSNPKGGFRSRPFVRWVAAAVGRA